MPIVPGTTETVETLEDAQKIAEEIGYPIAVKAAGGGGGKGFRVALEPDKLQEAFEGAAREGEKFFSDDTVYLERYLPDPRHVEVQILADKARQHDPPRRARLLDPAPPPEADRGVAGAARRRGAARADRQDRRRRRQGRRLPLGRHDRGPAPGRRVLLPRDEHARAGRALRDRGGLRHRHRAQADPRRRRRGRCRSPRTRWSCAATRSSAASTPRTPPRTSPPRPGTVTHYREPAGPGVRVDSGVLAARRSRRCTTRWSPS